MGTEKLHDCLAGVVHDSTLRQPGAASTPLLVATYLQLPGVALLLRNKI